VTAPAVIRPPAAARGWPDPAAARGWPGPAVLAVGGAVLAHAAPPADPQQLPGAVRLLLGPRA
jgi:hypothetical protein